MSRSRIGAVVRVSLGNFLEMYDFMVFGYYAAAIGRAFFPTKNEYASLMLSLMTFGTGYLMRPLGAIVLGAYIDHHGRRKGLLLTLALMAVGTLSIGIMPGYETIGFFAPLLVVLGRLVQGLSAGVEIGGVSVYLAEIATPGRKGFFVSWQSGSQQVAVIFAALLGLILSSILRPEQMAGWGWRVPLLIGSMLIPFLLTPYPILMWLVSMPSFLRLLAAALWLSMIFGSYNGAMVVFLTEIMPADVRVSGFSFSYSLATGIFGGFTPAVSTWLIHQTGNAAMPGVWLGFAGLPRLLATLVLTSRGVQRPAQERRPAI